MADIITPESAVQWKGTANDLFIAKDYQGAESLYTKILREFSQTAAPDFLRAVRCNHAACLIEMGKFQDAIPDLESVIRTTPTNLNSAGSFTLTQKAHYRLGRCLFELGKMGDAIKEMDKYREITGGRPTEAESTLRNKIVMAIVARDEKLAAESKVLFAPTQTQNYTHPRRSSNKPSRQVPSDSTGGRVLRYEVKISTGPSHPDTIVKTDTVPSSLCSMHPPERPTKVFLAQLVNKHHEAILRQRNWTCWNCPRRAVGLVHTPASYLHLAEPLVVDFVQPVCINGGACDREARKMMDEEMRLAAKRG